MSSTEATVQSDPLLQPQTPQDIGHFLKILAAGKDDKCLALRKIRDILHLSTAEAADLAGKSSGTINAWENGRSWPVSIASIIEYLRAIGVTSRDIDEHFTRSHALLMQGTLNEISTAEALETLLRSESRGDVHEFQRLAFDAGIPKMLCSLLIKGAGGDTSAIKIAREWWNEWKREEAARTSKPQDVTNGERDTTDSWVMNATKNTPKSEVETTTSSDRAENSGERKAATDAGSIE